MKCPFCGSENLKVIDSRAAEDNTIRRRRECEQCQSRFTTYEKIETLPLMVIKKDESREPFDREKLIDRIMRSTSKRPVSTQQIEQIADEIENYGTSKLSHEITSGEIGELVMGHLKKIDEVAYVRFASVYREFKDVNSFMNELRTLIDQDDKKKKAAKQ